MGSFKRYHVNEDFFNRIDTEAKAYWLGFIWADGHVRNQRPCKISLTIKDKDHLEKMKQNLDFDGNIREVYGSGFNPDAKLFAMEICRQKLTSRLVDLGRNNRDLHIPKIPKKLVKHFIRGYFDGDGSVYTYTKSGKAKNGKVYSYHFLEVAIIGQISILEDIKLHLENENIKCRYKNSKTDWMKYLMFQTKPDIERLYRYLYKDATVFMDRKEEIFKSYYCPSGK